jgi:hypothetical protein
MTSTISTDSISYSIDGHEYDYEPKNYMGALDWFNIARCARERMTENCHNINRWRGERRSFYSSIQAMDADTKYLMD